MFLRVCVFVSVSGALLVAVRSKKHRAAPRNGCCINACPVGREAAATGIRPLSLWLR